MSVSKVSSRSESIAKSLKKCEYQMYPNLTVTLNPSMTEAVII